MTPDFREKNAILIVDDLELFIQLQISYLGRQRFDIHTACNGAEALEKARSLQPDLILLDLHMPDMNGDQVCRILKGDPGTSSIPIIIVSSGTKDYSRVATITAGCDGLLYKPVRKDLLLTIVEECLGISIRRQPRVTVSLSGALILDATDSPMTISSLSSGGAFVETEQSLIRGDVLTLVFSLSGEETVSVHSAVVVWCGRLDQKGPIGAGVLFLTIDTESRYLINECVRHHSEMRDEKAQDQSAVET